jgi:predicted AAA+ superfamily ATPase
MQNITESLAGRVAIMNLLGLSWRERERRGFPSEPFLPEPPSAFEGSDPVPSPERLFEAVWKGSLPALVTGQSEDWELFYSSYMQTYIQRDVRDVREIGSLEQFNRFVRACAARTAQVLNLSDIANDVGVSVKTAKTWISVLEAGFQVFLLRPYFSNKLKRLIKSPKLYFLDTGLCCYLTGWNSPEAVMNGAMAGALFETFVFAEILRRYWNVVRQAPIYYYRDRQKNEIDFVLEANQELYPVEAKLGATVRKEWIRSFKQLKGHAHGAVVCQANRALAIDDSNTAIPWSLI